MKVTVKLDGKKITKNPQTSTLGTYFSNLAKYFELNDYPEDLKKKTESGGLFEMSHKIFSSRKKELTKQGFGNLPNARRMIEEGEEEMMWTSGAFGDDNPESLLHALFWLVSLQLGFRASNEAVQLKLGDFEEVHDENGEIKWIQWSERSSKCRQGENPYAEAHVRPFLPKLMPNKNNPSRDPIRLYQLYLEKRPLEKKTPESDFYLAINTNRPHPDSKWFKNSNMGKERIGQIVKRAATKAKLSNLQWVGNHSIRKTMVTRLCRAKVPHVLIAQLSGHKNVNSLGRYIVASLEEQKQMNLYLFFYHYLREMINTCLWTSC